MRKEKFYNFKFSVFILLIILLGCIGCKDIFTPPEKKSFTEIIANQGEFWGIPGIVLHVKTPSEDRSYTFNLPSYKAARYFEPVSENSLFRLGSISKTYTTVLIMLLREIGFLTLDQPISDYIPYPCTIFISNLKNITIRNLLNHTSGIGDYIANTEVSEIRIDSIGQIGHFWKYPNIEWSMEDLLSRITTLQVPPGNHYYSNVNFLLAGKIVHNYIQSRSMECHYTPKLKNKFSSLFEKWGLNQTCFLEEEYTMPNIAHGYEKDLFEIIDVTSVHPSLTHTAGGIIASASDVSKFLNLLFGGEIINATSLNEMLKFDPSGYGLGIYKKGNRYGKTIYFHSGLVPGYLSLYHYYREENITIVLLMNTGTSPSAENCQNAILKEIEDKLFN